jgi:hypothetical protein
MAVICTAKCIESDSNTSLSVSSLVKRDWKETSSHGNLLEVNRNKVDRFRPAKFQWDDIAVHYPAVIVLDGGAHINHPRLMRGKSQLVRYSTSKSIQWH